MPGEAARAQVIAHLVEGGAAALPRRAARRDVAVAQEPASDDLAVLRARRHRDDAFVQVREDAEHHPPVPERVDERDALLLERALALGMESADADRGAQPQDPRADDAGGQSDSVHGNVFA